MDILLEMVTKKIVEYQKEKEVGGGGEKEKYQSMGLGKLLFLLKCSMKESKHYP